MDILRASGRNLSRTAVVLEGNNYSYQQLLQTADAVRAGVKAAQKGPTASKFGPRVGIYAAPGPEYVSSTWGSWLAGGIAVPLATSHPPRELDYVIKDAGIESILVPEEHFDKVKDVAHENQVNLQVLESSTFTGATGAPISGGGAGGWSEERIATELAGASGYDGGALIMYTSGTTGKPKGVLHTHRSVMAQVRALTEAWRWAAEDRILHSLPLHHTHGIINALYCSLHNGATVELLPRFSPARVWSRIQSGDISVFMGVPTMYALLLAAYDGMTPQAQAASREAASKLRLTISGSAACPLPIMNRWAELSGRPLLERYGMTETGMIVSNPYEGERRAGTVGVPLPGVEVRLAVEAGSSSEGNGDAPVGEIRVKGDALFREYWGRPEATAEAYDEAGWFRTGDTGTLEGAPAFYRILGRTSVDIIKSGGYKISALHIESVLLEHPQVAECAVLGVPDDTYGEVVAALVAPKTPTDGQAAAALDVVQLRKFCGESLPPYQVPRVVVQVGGLPRNAMGKINKKQLLATYLDQLTAARK